MTYQMIVVKLDSKMQIWLGTTDIPLQGIYLSCLEELLAGLAGKNQLSHSQPLKRSILHSVQPHKRLWLKLLSDIKITPMTPTIIREDNQGTIAVARNPSCQARTKHYRYQVSLCA